MSAPSYATVEQLQAAADFKTTAYETDRLKRHLLAASRQIEERFHRRFYPLTQTVTYTDPPTVTPRRTQNAGFWLEDDLLALTAATVDDVAQTVADIELYPSAYGPPYSWIGLTGSDIDVTGRWGYSEDSEFVGIITENLGASTGAVDINDGAAAEIGILDLIKINDEQILVTGKTWKDTGDNTSGALTADVSDTTVTAGDDYTVGELILIDSERMLIVDKTGSDLTVKRGWDGSVLAAHSSGADVYAQRTINIDRGAAGTTAAAHSSNDQINRSVPPQAITELCIAEALVKYAQETAGYARTIGSGDNERESKGPGLAQARRDAEPYRRTRFAAV